MDISVILCTWNNADRLDITLGAFCKLVIPDALCWQLVVVNNNSNDATSEIVRRYIGRLPITYVEEPRQGLSFARNAGVRAAIGELLVFTDDDVKPCVEWLSVYWAAYRKSPSGHFWGGPIESEFEAQAVNPVLLMHAPCSVKGLFWGDVEKTLSNGEWFVSANWACPSSAMPGSDPFDVDKGLNPERKNVSVGEETDLMERLQSNGYLPRYLPSARLKHFVSKDKTSLKHVAVRARAYGYYCGEKDRYSVVGRSWFFGVPLWIVKDIALHGVRFVASLAIMRFDYVSYLAICRRVGYVQALRRTVTSSTL